MRNPVRSETDAFYVAVGGAALIGVSLAVGALVDPIVGVALFVGALVGALVWDLASKNPDRRRTLAEAATQGRAAPTGRPARGSRVLVVANRTLGGEELHRELRERGAKGAELHMVAPIHPSRVKYIASDVDSELRDARDRLDAALAWAKAEGIKASGKVGDPAVALGAIEDELRQYGADEVVISTLATGKSNWLETGIVDRLREELDIPVTHVVVDVETPSAA